MNHGEIWTAPQGARVLIVSNDDFNQVSPHGVLTVPLARTRPSDHLGQYTVVTNEQDPVSGTFHLPLVGIESLEGGTYLGLVTGATASSVTAGLQALFTY